jgi:hypothetical protein
MAKWPNCEKWPNSPKMAQSGHPGAKPRFSVCALKRETAISCKKTFLRKKNFADWKRKLVLLSRLC